MKKFMKEKVFNEKYELQERILRLIVLVGFVLSLASIAVSIYVENFFETFLPLLSMFIGMLVGVILTFKYNKLNIAAVIIAIIINVIAFPVMFFLCGAIESGASVWLVLGIICLFMLFRGKKLVLFLILNQPSRLH